MRRLLTVMVAALMAAGAFAQAKALVIKGTLKTANDVKTGSIKWSVKEKAYITQRKAGNMVVDEITKPEDVVELSIDKPEGWDQIAAAVDAGRGATVMKKLEAIAKNYAHLQWDKTATRYLAKAYLDSGNNDAALKACNTVIGMEPEAAYVGELAPMYWQTLLRLNRLSNLESALKKAAVSGDRYASGAALIMRGDITVAGKDGDRDAAKKALQDGYLRVIFLYQDVPELPPEALYKAAKCFETMGQAPRAAAMRSELRQKYPSSPWAAK